MISGVSAEDINNDISVDDTIATDNLMTANINALGDSNTIVDVDNEKDLEDALNDNNTKEIRLTKDIGLSHSLKVPVNHPKLKIDGQNHKIYPNEGFVPQSNGGALYWDSDDGCLINCVFDGFINYYVINGGAIFWFNTNGVIANCSFINCFAANGGAIYFNHTNSIIQNCSFLNNGASNKGNSIYLNGPGITIDGCKFNQTHEEYSNSEIYISGYCEDTVVSNNVMLSEPPELLYAAVQMDNLGSFGAWATVKFNNNKFNHNVILCSAEIESHINAVFDSEVVKKGETAIVKGTVYDDDGNYIIPDYDWAAIVSGTRYAAEPCDLFYYFSIPTKDLKQGVYKIESDLQEIQNVTHKGNLTVLPYVAPTKFINVTKGTVYNGKYYSARLVDSFGNALASKNVAIKIAGKTYNVKTDNKGLAKVKLALNSKYIGKSLTVTYKFSGDNDSKACKGSSKIKVIKTPTKIVNATKLVVKNHKNIYVKLTTKSGKVLANKIITMESAVSGKIYKIKTNSKGIAKKDLWVKNKALGKYYKYTFKYAGNKYYNSYSKTFKIKLIK